MDADTPVMHREPLDAGALRTELVRSHPHDPVTVRVCIDGVGHEYCVTSVERWRNAGGPDVTTRIVGEELVTLTRAEDDR